MGERGRRGKIGEGERDKYMGERDRYIREADTSVLSHAHRR